MGREVRTREMKKRREDTPHSPHTKILHCSVEPKQIKQRLFMRNAVKDNENGKGGARYGSLHYCKPPL